MCCCLTGLLLDTEHPPGFGKLGCFKPTTLSTTDRKPLDALDDQDGFEVGTYEVDTRESPFLKLVIMPFSLNQLCQAIEAGNVDAVTAILELKPAVKLNGMKVQTYMILNAAHRAPRHSAPARCILLAKQATPPSSICLLKLVPMSTLLTRYKQQKHHRLDFDCSTCVQKGRTPLCLAIKRKRAKAAKRLLEAGAYVNMAIPVGDLMPELFFLQLCACATGRIAVAHCLCQGACQGSQAADQGGRRRGSGYRAGEVKNDWVWLLDYDGCNVAIGCWLCCS